MHLLFFKNVVGEHAKFGVRDENAGFFLCLANGGLLWGFPKIKMPNGRCPRACTQRMRSLFEQDTIAVQDQNRDANFNNPFLSIYHSHSSSFSYVCYFSLEIDTMLSSEQRQTVWQDFICAGKHVAAPMAA